MTQPSREELLETSVRNLLDILDGARSGFVAGSETDEAWDKGKASRVADARAALNTSCAQALPSDDTILELASRIEARKHFYVGETRLVDCPLLLEAERQTIVSALRLAAPPASSGEVRAELPPHYAFPLRVEGDSIKDANGSYVCDFSSIHGWKARNEMVAFIVAATNAYALKSPSVAVQPVGEWRPIETAPKDGTSFLVTMAGGEDGPYYVLFWNDTFFESAESGEGPSMDHLTHRQPLPAPPSTVSSTTRGGSE